jgi:hypothetical protein
MTTLRRRGYANYKYVPVFNGRVLNLNDAQECEAAVMAGVVKEPNNLWFGTFFPVQSSPNYPFLLQRIQAPCRTLGKGTLV